jgi:hypothetical protein
MRRRAEGIVVEKTRETTYRHIWLWSKASPSLMAMLLTMLVAEAVYVREIAFGI